MNCLQYFFTERGSRAVRCRELWSLKCTWGTLLRLLFFSTFVFRAVITKISPVDFFLTGF